MDTGQGFEELKRAWERVNHRRPAAVRYATGGGGALDVKAKNLEPLV